MACLPPTGPTRDLPRAWRGCSPKSAAIVPRHLDHVPDAIIPEIDDVYDLAGDRAVRIERHEERLPGASAGHRDWHNDYAELLLEISDAVEAAAGRNSKGVIIRRIRDALRDEARE